MTQNVGFQMAEAGWEMQALQEELQATLVISESMYHDLLSSEEKLSQARRQFESEFLPSKKNCCPSRQTAK
jgi:hypothetical protein